MRYLKHFENDSEVFKVGELYKIFINNKRFAWIDRDIYVSFAMKLYILREPGSRIPPIQQNKSNQALLQAYHKIHNDDFVIAKLFKITDEHDNLEFGDYVLMRTGEDLSNHGHFKCPYTDAIEPTDEEVKQYYKYKRLQKFGL